MDPAQREILLYLLLFIYYFIGNRSES